MLIVFSCYYFQTIASSRKETLAKVEKELAYKDEKLKRWE